MDASEVEIRELAPLVRTEDLWRTESLENVLLSLATEAVSKVFDERQNSNFAAQPVHYCDQVQQAALQRILGGE